MRLLFALAFVVAFNVIALEALCPEGAPGGGGGRTRQPPTPEPPTPEPPTPEPPTPEPPTPSPPTQAPNNNCNKIATDKSISSPTTRAGYLGKKQTGSTQSCCEQCKTYDERNQVPDGNLNGVCLFWSFEKQGGRVDDCFFFDRIPTSFVGITQNGNGHAYGTPPTQGNGK